MSAAQTVVGRRARRALLLHLAAAGVSLALALVFGWQGVAHPVTLIWGDFGDAWQNWWNGWWMGYALSQGHSPFFTHLLWHPDGVSLWLQTFGPLNALLTAVGRWLLPGFAGYNLLVLFHLAFGCYGGFVLAWGIIERAREARRLPERLPAPARFGAAMAGGATFGLSPYVWAHISTHLHLTSIGFVALFVHALLESRARPGWRWPVAAGLFALATALCGWYLIVDEAIIAGVVLAISVSDARRHGWEPVGRLALAGVGSAVLCLPLAIPTFIALHQPLAGAHSAWVFSADLWSFFVPAPVQALGTHFRAITTHFTGNAGENGGYLGYGALALAGLGLVAIRGRRLVALAVAGLAGLVLSLGPRLHVGGVVYGRTPLPYGWLAKALPVLNGLGCPVRFELPANLFLAAGVAAGIAWIAGRLFLRAAPAWVLAAAVVLAGAAVAGEYAPLGQPTRTLPAPTWLTALANDPRPWTMADLTGWTEPLWHQTLHHHPILGGYVSRRPRRLEQNLFFDPLLGDVYRQVLYGGQGVQDTDTLRGPDSLAAHQDHGVHTKLSPAEARAYLLDHWGVRYVLTHTAETPWLVSHYLGLTRVHEGDGLTLWEVRRRSVGAVAPVATFPSDEGGSASRRRVRAHPRFALVPAPFASPSSSGSATLPGPQRAWTRVLRGGGGRRTGVGVRGPIWRYRHCRKGLGAFRRPGCGVGCGFPGGPGGSGGVPSAHGVAR